VLYEINPEGSECEGPRRMTAPFRVTLNYRRDDTSGHAGRLYDALVERFGSEHVFMDIDAIEPGDGDAPCRARPTSLSAPRARRSQARPGGSRVNLDKIVRAGELARRGYRSSEIASELGVSKSSVLRARKERPDLFEEPEPVEHEPGSEEYRRWLLLQTLETGTFAEKLKAEELLRRMSQRPGRYGSTTIYVADIENCPHCGEPLKPQHVEPVPDDS
jgi:hypothetical protein